MNLVKIKIEVTPLGYSFMNQARALASGLMSLGVEVGWNNMDEKDADVVLGIGSWKDYELLVSQPSSRGAKRVVPWIVSDEKVGGCIEKLNHLDLILTPSQNCKSIMIRDGVRAEVIKILPEAVDDKYWKPGVVGDAQKSVSELLTISDEQTALPFNFDLIRLKHEGVPILFTTGGVATDKGALEVIQALGLLFKDFKIDRWIYLIKSWPSSTSFKKSAEELELATKLGIWNHIKYVSGEFSGDMLKGLIDLCDIYVAPSRIEGFGLPLVEAAMNEKPVITSEGTAACETVIHKETGFVSKSIITDEGPRADVKDLSGYLETLISDHDLRVRMGKRGRLKAMERYSPVKVAQQFLELVS